MTNVFDIFINGLGSFIISADVSMVKSKKSKLKCEVEIVSIKKYNEESEVYTNYIADPNELVLLKNEVATKFVNSLH